MPVRLLIAVLIVLFVCLLAVAVDWAIKSVKRSRRRLDATRRLAAAAADGEAKHRRRKAAEQVSGALTSVMPTIHDIDTRHVDSRAKPPLRDRTAPGRRVRPDKRPGEWFRAGRRPG